MDSVSRVSRVSAIAEVADMLLINSGELLTLVVELGEAVDEGVNSLKLPVLPANGDNQEPSETELINAEINRVEKDRAIGVVELSVQAAMSIRRLLGLNDRPYMRDERKYGTTLIGIEDVLIELSSESSMLACSCVDENIVIEIHKRIIVMSAAAGKNTAIAKAILCAVDSLGRMAFEISRIYK